tara:strand:- start:414 stop:551 length:138 start_codon:yes stop_codon:yes gene_type:complete
MEEELISSEYMDVGADTDSYAEEVLEGHEDTDEAKSPLGKYDLRE